MLLAFVAGIALCAGGLALSLYAYVKYKTSARRRNAGFPLANRQNLSRGRVK